MHLPQRVMIREVGPRDGLQAESTFIETRDKIGLINGLIACGIDQIEATSMVNPRAIPQLRDAEEVVRGIGRKPRLVISALVGNARGVERAIRAGVDEVQMVISVSETHNQRNMNMSIAESLTQLEKVMLTSSGTGLKVRAAAAVTFGCPFEGKIPVERLINLVSEYRGLGIRQVTLADTAGLGNPRQVYEVVNELRDHFPCLDLALHFHDTRGLGLANVVAGMQAGIEIIESSIGGLGGCPFIPRATGNIATEDLVFLCESMGVETGVSLAGLFEVVKQFEEVLGKRMPGRLRQTLDDNGCTATQ
ncbi:MAG: hydroxymethylglutaryl-CoA lyase [Firmicutes bacterium]|nr:hydroxymethylglutaryl-CoA lyase [Bacillota bacterium]